MTTSGTHDPQQNFDNEPKLNESFSSRESFSPSRDYAQVRESVHENVEPKSSVFNTIKWAAILGLGGAAALYFLTPAIVGAAGAVEGWMGKIGVDWFGGYGSAVAGGGGGMAGGTGMGTSTLPGIS